MDHIISRKHGGPTVAGNLALSCVRGWTAIGRVTVSLFKINQVFRVELREELIEEGVFPPQ